MTQRAREALSAPAGGGDDARRSPARRHVAYKWIALSNTTVGTLMAALDTNIVLIALPTIGRQLAGTSVFDLLWILIGYSLVTAVVILNFGRLGDMFGRVKLYTLGFAVFTVGSALCGLSQTGLELVGFRMVQALGAGFLFANAAAILTDAFPPGERGKALGVNQISIVVGSVSGLVLGGYLTQFLGWRAIFYVNVPIGIFATLWSRARLRELAVMDPGQGIDWMGNLTFASGLTLILLAVTLGALQAQPGADTLGELFLGVALLGLFAYVETRVPNPMFDFGLFRIRIFSAANLAMFLNALARGAFSFVMVFFLQGPPRFLDPLTAGLFLIPVSASLAAMGPVSGVLSDRYGSRPFAILGLLVSAAGFFLLLSIGPGTTFSQLVLPLVLVGAGMGLFASPNRAAVMNSVPPNRRGVGAGIGTTLVNSGATLSLGFAILVMSGVIPVSELGAIFLGTTVSGVAVNISRFMDAIHLVFLISGLLLLVSVVPAALRGPEERRLGPPPAPAGGA